MDHHSRSAKNTTINGNLLAGGSSGTPGGSHSRRRLIVVRHGERIDFTFNPSCESWTAKAFDNGKYQRFNINMPRNLPLRKDGNLAYATDTPLTEIGYLQAKITGRALKESGIKVNHVYCSPAYRCVQTCVGILKGMNSQHLCFNIEPCLFEWGAWFKPQLPSFMKLEEFQAQGLPVNVNHKILLPSVASPSETLEEYYNRSFHVVQRILDKHREDGFVGPNNERSAAAQGCTILLVAHGASLDTCTRQLTGKPPRSQQDFYTILHATPYLATTSCSEDTNGQWKISESPILPFQHSSNNSYNYKILIDDKSHQDSLDKLKIK